MQARKLGDSVKSTEVPLGQTGTVIRMGRIGADYDALGIGLDKQTRQCLPLRPQYVEPNWGLIYRQPFYATIGRIW